MVGLFLAAGCRFHPKPKPAAGNCLQGSLDFENPSPGGTFVVGTSYPDGTSIFNYQGLSAVVTSLAYPNGSVLFGQAMVVTNTPFPFGSGQMIQLGSALVSFDLRQNTRKAVFEYLDRGGTINLSASSGPGVYVGNMWNMPTTSTINGVTVTKTAVKSFFNPVGVKVAESGTITLSLGHDIGSLRIGGSEMHLDNFCFN